jgi:hypothetical protein
MKVIRERLHPLSASGGKANKHGNPIKNGKIEKEKGKGAYFCENRRNSGIKAGVFGAFSSPGRSARGGRRGQCRFSRLPAQLNAGFGV